MSLFRSALLLFFLACPMGLMGLSSKCCIKDLLARGLSRPVVESLWTSDSILSAHLFLLLILREIVGLPSRFCRYLCSGFVCGSGSPFEDGLF